MRKMSTGLRNENNASSSAHLSSPSPTLPTATWGHDTCAHTHQTPSVRLPDVNSQALGAAPRPCHHHPLPPSPVEADTQKSIEADAQLTRSSGRARTRLADSRVSLSCLGEKEEKLWVELDVWNQPVQVHWENLGNVTSQVHGIS